MPRGAAATAFKKKRRRKNNGNKATRKPGPRLPIEERGDTKNRSRRERRRRRRRRRRRNETAGQWPRWKKGKRERESDDVGERHGERAAWTEIWFCISGGILPAEIMH